VKWESSNPKPFICDKRGDPFEKYSGTIIVIVLVAHACNSGSRPAKANSL
jgi:hypothetical protein